MCQGQLSCIPMATPQVLICHYRSVVKGCPHASPSYGSFHIGSKFTQVSTQVHSSEYLPALVWPKWWETQRSCNFVYNWLNCELWAVSLRAAESSAFMTVRHLWTAKNPAENGYCTSQMLRHLSTYVAANHVHIELWMLTNSEQVQNHQHVFSFIDECATT